MGDIKVGDLATAPDGTTTTIIGVYPQGRKPIYRITFEDGRSTDCCDEHLWKVCDASGCWMVTSLAQLRENLSDGIFAIPLIRPEAGDNAHSSAAQRWSTLQTLMATCGVELGHGTTSFINTDISVVTRVVYLVRSLGGIAQYTSIDADRYRVDITVPQFGSTLGLKIRSITSVGDEECQCIAVNHPDHY